VVKFLLKKFQRISRKLATKVGYPEHMEYTVQAKVWMDEANILDWMVRVWIPPF
jgi:hypothetical protein